MGVSWVVDPVRVQEEVFFRGRHVEPSCTHSLYWASHFSLKVLCRLEHHEKASPLSDVELSVDSFAGVSVCSTACLWRWCRYRVAFRDSKCADVFGPIQPCIV